jgi:EmrB/QacA subfamily drug resistance transporter
MNTALHAPCDAISARLTKNLDNVVDHPRLVIAATTLASSLAFIDGSVVNVGLPAIRASFDANADDLQWIVNAYLLPLSALLLLGGAAGDRYGRRRLLIIGTILFALASLACAMAPNLLWLLIARGVQGLSSALLMPNSIAILGQTFSGEAKGRAVGLWAAIGTATAAIGPVVGGWLIDIASWRLVFVINVPIAAAAVAIAYTYVPSDRDGGDVSLDGFGAVLVTGGLAFTTWALTALSSAGWSTPAAAALAAGVVLLVIFVLAERRRGSDAMMPLALFGSPSFVGLTLLTLLLYGALGGLFVLVPYELIVSHGYSATQAGAALLPLPLVIAVVSPAAGSLASRIGPRWPLIVSSIVVALGFLLAPRIGAGDSFWAGVLPSMIVIALGTAGAVAPLTTAVLMSVDADHAGSASGLNSAVARTGGLIATALLGPVLGANGPALSSAFGLSMVIAAAASVAAAACALLIKQP